MRLNKEEKLARIAEVEKELRSNQRAPLDDLLQKWAITRDDFDTLRKQTAVAPTHPIRRRTTMTCLTEESKTNSLVCPVTKIPLGVIAKIRGVLREQKQNPKDANLDKMLQKWEVDRKDYETYKSVIEGSQQNGAEPKYSNIRPKTSLPKSLLNSKNVFKVATIPVTLASKSASGKEIPPNVVIMNPQNANGNPNMPFLMTQAAPSDAGNLQRMHDWLNGGGENQRTAPNFTANLNVKKTVEKIQLENLKSQVEQLKSQVGDKVAIERVVKGDSNRVKRLKKSENKCVNCGTHTATLWRRIKSPEEIEAKRPYVKAQTNHLEYTGKLACNSCALYWSLHGVSTFLTLLDDLSIFC